MSIHRLTHSGRPWLWLVLLILAGGCSSVPERATTAAHEDPVAAFDALVADYEQWRLEQDPIEAGQAGDLQAQARWPDGSPEAVAARRRAQAGLLRRLQQIDTAVLDEGRQTSHAVLGYLLSSAVELSEFEPERIPFVNDSGFFSMPLSVAQSIRPRGRDEAEAWLKRLERLPDYLATQQAWMERGIADGFVQPALVVERVIAQLESIVAMPVTGHPLLAPIQALPSTMDDEARASLEGRARQLIEARVQPAYVELLAFFRDRYLPAARRSIGISEVPGGRDYYRALVRYHTTLPMTPEQVHERGLSEVERIRSEVESLIATLGFEGSFAEFLEFLREDPRFYAETPEMLLMHAAWIAKRADDQMPRFFSRLPRLPYGVRPVPAHLAPAYTTGRYWPGNLDAGVAGGYMVNTYALDQRPLYELPALTLHEAVPGHHHQIALAQELEKVPKFRRHTYITAFGEGWGLYSERLGIEMGIYTTPYEHFGRLSYEMWRACRLVVDTGIHYYGWSREQAEACLLENSALAPHNVRTEVERYISWPGQALAYKTGELLIRDLRAEAESSLGQDFDLRAFHDHLLAEGAMPLAALEKRMRRWIRQQRSTDQATDQP
ncbi:MAG: DUF885 family protein [Wenzhouxiangellaceae bacterium]